MKTIVVIVISSFFCFASFGQNSVDDLKNDEIVVKFFEEKDLNSLVTIINLYDSWVIKQTGISEIDSAYHVFCEKAKYNEDMQEYISKTKLPQNQLDSIILKCDISWTFNKLWIYNYGKKINQIDTLIVTIAPNLDWKYGDFLNELLKEKTILVEYIESIKAAGEIGPSLFLGLPWSHEHYDFEKLHYRLFFALHFVTGNYVVEYHKINP